jgi:hypothetical protein
MDKKQELNPLLSGLFITNGLRNNLPISPLFVVVLAAIVAEYVRVLFLQFNATPCFFFFFSSRKNRFLMPSFIHKYMHE